jgi:hypothetical protein
VSSRLTDCDRIISGLFSERAKIDDGLLHRSRPHSGLPACAKSVTLKRWLHVPRVLFRHSGWRDCDQDVLSRGAESQTYLKHQRRLLQKKVCITSAPQPPQISSIGSLHARHMQSTASLPSAWSTYVLQYVSGVFRRCWHDAVVRTDRVCTHE